MALTEQGDENLFEHLILADDDAAELFGHLLVGAGEVLGGAQVGFFERFGSEGGTHREFLGGWRFTRADNWQVNLA